MRTQRVNDCYRHIINSMKMVERLEKKVAVYDNKYANKLIMERNYEMLEEYVLNLLMS